MKNIFLLVTDDKITMDEKLEEIIKKNPDSEVVQYDLTEVAIDVLIEDLDTYNFLASKKIIVGKNATFLSTDKTKVIVEHHLEKLEKYLESPSEENILVLVCSNLDKKKKITTTLLKNATVMEEGTDFHEILKKKLEDYKMDSNTEKLLLEYCSNHHERVLQELEKLKMYKLEEKVIKKEDIENVVMKDIDDNIFHLVDAFLSGNKKEAFLIYHHFIQTGKQATDLLPLVANKIRLIYQVKVLLQDGNSDKAISQKLSVHEYPVKLARESSYHYTEEKLLSYLEKLSQLDLDIKSGKSTGEMEFETLLATI